MSFFVSSCLSGQPSRAKAASLLWVQQSVQCVRLFLQRFQKPSCRQRQQWDSKGQKSDSLGGGYSFGGILYQGCCGVSQCYWHRTSSPPLLFRKGLYRNLNIRRKVKLLIWQLETVCALLCPRTEHNVIHKLEVLAQTISSVVVKCLIARILKVAESQDSSDSRAMIAGQKANIPNIDADSNSKTVFAELTNSSFLEWNKLPWQKHSSLCLSSHLHKVLLLPPLCHQWAWSYHSSGWHHRAIGCRSRDLTWDHPGSASGLTPICEQSRCSPEKKAYAQPRWEIITHVEEDPSALLAVVF